MAFPALAPLYWASEYRAVRSGRKRRPKRGYTSTSINASAVPMTSQPLRLPPGADLRRALEALAQHAQSGFVVAGIGSLRDPRIRFANAAAATTLPGDFELLTLSGSVTPVGAHLHMTVADQHGQVFGGHVTEGNIIRTTAEILLAWLPAHALARAYDPATGFDELTVRTV